MLPCKRQEMYAASMPHARRVSDDTHTMVSAGHPVNRQARRPGHVCKQCDPPQSCCCTTDQRQSCLPADGEGTGRHAAAAGGLRRGPRGAAPRPRVPLRRGTAAERPRLRHLAQLCGSTAARGVTAQRRCRHRCKRGRAGAARRRARSRCAEGERAWGAGQVRPAGTGPPKLLLGASG